MSAHMYSYMCTKYICVYIRWEAGWDLGLIAFSFNTLFLSKKKSKRCERKPPIISNLTYKIWVHRPSIKSTKPLFTVNKQLSSSWCTQSTTAPSCNLHANPVCFACLIQIRSCFQLLLLTLACQSHHLQLTLFFVNQNRRYRWQAQLALSLQKTRLK